jgi:hypothetical protein
MALPQGSPLSKEQALHLLHSDASDEVGFLQFFNVRYQREAVADVVNNEELVRVATQLLGCQRVRIYQVCLGMNKHTCYQVALNTDFVLMKLHRAIKPPLAEHLVVHVRLRHAESIKFLYVLYRIHSIVSLTLHHATYGCFVRLPLCLYASSSNKQTILVLKTFI